MTRAIKKYYTDFLAVLGVFVLALGALGYIISQQEARPRIPLIEGKAFKLKVELESAQAVEPGQGQEVTTAGVQIGKVGAVELEEGKAIVDLDIDPKYKGLAREDATALLRPKTGLKDMFIEVDPGSKSARPLEEEERIPVANTAPDVDPDEILDALDSDTRGYLQLLLNGGGKGLENRGNDLREVFRRLGPLHRDLARVMEAIAERRSNLRRLIHNYGSLTTRLGREDDDLKRLVTASNETLGAFADENQNISAAVRELPPTLDTTASTLGKVERLGRVLGPSLESLRPAFRQLPETNAALRPLAREGTPILRNRVRPFVRRARPYVRDLRPAAVDLSSAAPDLNKSLLEFNRFFNMASYNENGAEGISQACERNGACSAEERNRRESYLYWLAWTAQNGVSLFSTGDAAGPFRRAAFFFNCSTLQDVVSQQNPLFAVVFGLTEVAGGVGCEGVGG
jgi:phospholipid/cholesterol/gamma-HCH transport system substrate-binding protein